VTNALSLLQFSADVPDGSQRSMSRGLPARSSIEDSSKPSQIFAEIWQASFESIDAAAYHSEGRFEIALLLLLSLVGSSATAGSREEPS
jgi:hypothetical protein